MYNVDIRDPLITGNKTIHQVTEEIYEPSQKRPKLWWYVAFVISLCALGFGNWALYITISKGIGTWGLNNSIPWGWSIINFVWWIGIGHAGTAFSIFLLILRQNWRTSINRAAEAMTVAAVMCASLFPLFHLGRLGFFFYMMAYPNTRGPLWVNFNSPLFWDYVAIITYLISSTLFWYLGMVPDLATFRDKAKSKIKKALYGFFCFGWVGSSREWLRLESLHWVMGGLIAALVVSVHSIVAMDFATSILPGWHTTIFPPYFVVGAIFSGFAMVLTLMILIRKIYKLKDYITDSHLNAICKILVFVSLIMATAYATELFIAWYSDNEYEIFTFFHNRVTGEYNNEFWIMLINNAMIPQLFWLEKIRKNLTIVFIISILINVGMWFERYVIVITSLSKDMLPSNWAEYSPSMIEIGLFIGTIGFFVICILLFFRYIPMIAIHEVKGVLKLTKI
ncbi:MAG TPA: NrfD/PsrC family molybdoenzyme membrane anchor subunit [Cyclobacteriaceae bacterium]|nr:NrfD/PsrC family molybdoenzyme membrane anchor subunit [Cyclobacteriaceae bacterium]